jgi:hypothetical protein
MLEQRPEIRFVGSLTNAIVQSPTIDDEAANYLPVTIARHMREFGGHEFGDVDVTHVKLGLGCIDGRVLSSDLATSLRQSEELWCSLELVVDEHIVDNVQTLPTVRSIYDGLVLASVVIDAVPEFCSQRQYIPITSAKTKELTSG